MDKSILYTCDALDLLRHLPSESASLIYMDPPWGINDGYAADQDDSEQEKDLYDLYIKSALCAYEVVSSNGVIVWHTPPRHLSFLRKLLDEVFGSQRFLEEIVLKRRTLPTGGAFPRENHSSYLVYSKSAVFTYSAPEKPADISRFNKKDSNGRHYTLTSLISPGDRQNLHFTWNGYTPAAGRHWRYNEEKLNTLDSEGRIEKSASGMPNLKRYHDEVAVPVGSVWDDVDLPPNERVRDYGAQQPLKPVERIINTYTNEGETILDPFCGTGTSLIAGHRLGRTWIGCESNEKVIGFLESRIMEYVGLELEVITEHKAAKLSFNGRDFDRLIMERAPNFGKYANPTHLLSQSPETTRLEFKQTLSRCIKSGNREKKVEQSVLKTIGAFLNTDGGTLLVGVADDNSVFGIEEEVEKLFSNSTDKFMLHYQNLFRNNFRAKFYPNVTESLETVQGRTVLRIDVVMSEEPCYVGTPGKDEKFYVRRNPATEELSGSQVFEYIRTRENRKK